MKKLLHIIYFDTRIDNREEVGTALGLSGRFDDRTLLLSAFQRWGKLCAEKLIGDFSFVVHDTQDDVYYCARDPLGIKPLYYVQTKRQLYFAGDLDVLFEKSGIEKYPNVEAIRSLLDTIAIDYNATMYENIFRLPPGHWMVVDKGTLDQYRYWRPETIVTDYSISQDKAVERFRVLFEQAIQDRIDEEKTTAFELSGGLDSSSVVSYLRQTDPKKQLNVYAMRFGNFSCDEGPYIDTVADKYGLSPTQPRIDLTDYTSRYDMAFNYNVNPHWPMVVTFTMVFPLVEQMRRDGMTAVITGQGGDHIMNGSPYALTEMLKRWSFVKLAGELWHVKNRRSVISAYLIRPFLSDGKTRFLKKILGMQPEMPEQKRYAVKSITESYPVLSRAFSAELQLVTSPIHAMMMDAAAFHAIEKHFGVEYRHPFFDVRLVEFMLSLPPWFKFGCGRKKYLLRLAMKGILPEKIRERSDKAEFSEVLLQQIDAMDLPPLLDDPVIVRKGWIDKEKIDVMYGKYRDGRLSPAETVTFWRYINVEYWYRHTFEPDKLSA
ncbi:asparagine synthetase B family protein [Thiomicrolovo sp. ZZH C-3]